jgi:hypothetical protein
MTREGRRTRKRRKAGEKKNGHSDGERAYMRKREKRQGGCEKDKRREEKWGGEYFEKRVVRGGSRK